MPFSLFSTGFRRYFPKFGAPNCTGLNSVSPKCMSTQNLRMWPSSEIVFADVIKMRSCCMRVGAASSDWFLLWSHVKQQTRGKEDHVKRQGMWRAGVMQLQAKAQQGLLVATKERRKDSFPGACRGSTALPTPRSQTYGLPNCEIIDFCYCKPCSLWYFVTIALGNEYNSLLCFSCSAWVGAAVSWLGKSRFSYRWF